MPLHHGFEQVDGERRAYYQWGDQKKYYYTPGHEQARKEAKRKALKQAAAAYTSGYGG